MNSKSRAPVWLAMLTATAVAGLLIVAGCALDKNGSGPGNVVTRIGGHSGQLIEPKRCLLKVAIVSRPFGDPTINEVVWRVADEQIIPPAERRAWEVNGLRVGRIVGELPLELEAILKETAPQKRVNPTNFFVDSGEPTLIIVSAAGRSSQPASQPGQSDLRQRLQRRQRLFSRDSAAGRGQQRFAAIGSRDPSRPRPADFSSAADRLPDRAPRVHDQQRPARGNHPRAGHDSCPRARPDRRHRLPSRVQTQPGQLHADPVSGP